MNPEKYKEEQISIIRTDLENCDIEDCKEKINLLIWQYGYKDLTLEKADKMANEILDKILYKIPKRFTF